MVKITGTALAVMRASLVGSKSYEYFHSHDTRKRIICSDQIVYIMPIRKITKTFNRLLSCVTSHIPTLITMPTISNKTRTFFINQQ